VEHAGRQRVGGRRQRLGVPVAVGARGVLVAEVEVAVGDDRLGDEQVVRLVAAVVAVRGRVAAQRRRVDRDEEEPEPGEAQVLTPPARGR
jgi:hypothetical protein